MPRMGSFIQERHDPVWKGMRFCAVRPSELKALWRLERLRCPSSLFRLPLPHIHNTVKALRGEGETRGERSALHARQAQ